MNIHVLLAFAVGIFGTQDTVGQRRELRVLLGQSASAHSSAEHLLTPLNCTLALHQSEFSGFTEVSQVTNTRKMKI